MEERRKENARLRSRTRLAPRSWDIAHFAPKRRIATWGSPCELARRLPYANCKLKGRRGTVACVPRLTGAASYPMLVTARRSAAHDLLDPCALRIHDPVIRGIPRGRIRVSGCKAPALVRDRGRGQVRSPGGCSATMAAVAQPSIPPASPVPGIPPCKAWRPGSGSTAPGSYRGRSRLRPPRMHPPRRIP